MSESIDSLIGRLQLLSRGNLLDNKHNRKAMDRHLQVGSKIKELIEDGTITSFLALESYYNFLLEKVEEDNTQMEEYVKEIKDFIL